MPISSYDPNETPDPEEWLNLDEAIRLQIILDWHTEAGIEIPNARAHAALHDIIENQLAMGDELPVLRKLQHDCFRLNQSCCKAFV